MARKLVVLVAAVVLGMSPGGGSAQEVEATVGLDEVGQGSLLTATDVPGRFVESLSAWAVRSP